jgi:hypothetical protein
MALITDATASWSAPATLASDQIWQVRAGSAFLTTTPSADPDDGFRLTEGEGVLIRRGKDISKPKMNAIGLDVDPLPPFARIGGVIAEALPSLAPLSRVKVSEVAPRRMIESGGHWVPWRGDVAPYMAEPMDATTSRRFDSAAFVGPARSSKSEALVMNTLAHAVLAQPRVVAVFSPSKDAAQEWSMGALDPLIMHSPELAARLASGKGADNVFSKRFRGGCRLTVDWPVPVLLHKGREARTSPFPGRTYPTGSVTGMPSAV